MCVCVGGGGGVGVIWVIGRRGECEVRKEGNVLFNDTLNTFYLQLYGVRHMVKDHSDSERRNPLLPHGECKGIYLLIFYQFI